MGGGCVCVCGGGGRGWRGEKYYGKLESLLPHTLLRL